PKSLLDGLIVTHHTSLNPLGQPGTALGGTAGLGVVLGAEAAADVLRLVSKCADKHGVLLILGAKKPDNIHVSGCAPSIELSLLAALALFLPRLQQLDDGLLHPLGRIGAGEVFVEGVAGKRH